MSGDWVITYTFDANPSMDVMDEWETRLAGFDASTGRIPGRGVDLTVYMPGELTMFEALNKAMGEIAHVVALPEPIGLEVLTELEHQTRAEAPTMPELMSAAEISDELGVSRQRVHQLRETAGFPAPLADLRGGAVWDADAVRRFRDSWQRRPGRPRTVEPTGALLQIRGGVPNVVVREVSTGRVIDMANENDRSVVPNSDGGWDVKKAGASRASAHAETQAEAIDRAREIVHNAGGGEVQIHGRDGRIRDSDTVKPGNDPNPPRDTK